MKRSWARRTAELHGQLSSIATTDLRWWLIAGGAAAVEPFGRGGDYVLSDATPTGDTFIGYRAAPPADPIEDAIARAKAARIAIRELDGVLPEQPLAVTLRGPSTNGTSGGNGALGATAVPSALDVAAFAIGDRCVTGRLEDPGLAAQLAAVLAGSTTPLPWHGETPFVCVSLGDDPLELARHGHRRAWVAGSGPWLGLGRARELATVSTCHLVVDGYGHARITGRIAELTRAIRRGEPARLPALAAVADGIPLGVAWRELPYPAPRVLPLGYALGLVLHRLAGRPDAPFSPTFQIPIAPGDRDDPTRVRRRVIPGILSVRFDAGTPEPYAVFEARARAVLAEEAAGRGLSTRLLAAARGAPAPLAWKRRSLGATRAAWLERLAEVIGGRACLSKIAVEGALPPSCAVSSPARLATSSDLLGGCVLTICEDAEHSAITACGSGLAGTTAAANELLDELLARVGDGMLPACGRDDSSSGSAPPARSRR